MLAHEAAKLTAAADINAIAHQKANQKYAEIMRGIENRARDGFGTYFSWICDDSDTYMGRAVSTAVRNRLTSDGYSIEHDDAGRHYVTWAKDNHGPSAIDRFVRRPWAALSRPLSFLTN